MFALRLLAAALPNALVGPPRSPTPLSQQIKVVNADSGIMVHKSDFVTVSNIAVTVEKPRWNRNTMPMNGHHATWAATSSNVLFTK